MGFSLVLSIFLLWIGITSFANSSLMWEEWWSYEGIAGPSYWGTVNPLWKSCSQGKQQSPINIDPNVLLFDPNLKHIHLEKHKIDGWLVNSGRDVSFNLDGKFKLRLYGGPLSYKYAVSNVTFHFGSSDEKGSEHTINKEHFAAEIQILAYNYELFGTMAAAQQFPFGLAMISVLVKIGDSNNTEFAKFAAALSQIKYRYQSARVNGISLRDLLPPTNTFVTYEGSMTKPGCEESVTWIVMNKPSYITKTQIGYLRELLQGPVTHTSQMAVSDNIRQTMPLHHRVLRTNINFQDPNRICNMERIMGYKTNLDNNKVPGAEKET